MIKFREYLKENTITVNDRKIRLTLPFGNDLHLVKLHTNELDRLFSKNKDFYIGAGGTENAIKGRYDKFGDFIQNSPTLEIPQIEVTSDGKINFGNGRHRYAWLRDHGIQEMPVAMTTKSMQNSKRLGLL